MDHPQVQAMIREAVIAERHRLAKMLIDAAKKRRERIGIGDAAVEEFARLGAALLTIE